MRFQKVRNPACLLSFSQRTCFMVLFLVFGSGRRKQEIQVTFISLSFWISICFPFLPSTSLSFLFFSLSSTFPLAFFTASRSNKITRNQDSQVKEREKPLIFLLHLIFICPCRRTPEKQIINGSKINEKKRKHNKTTGSQEK